MTLQGFYLGFMSAAVVVGTLLALLFGELMPGLVALVAFIVLLVSVMWLASVEMAVEHAQRTQQRTLEEIDADWYAYTVERGWWAFPLEQRVPLLLNWLEEEVKEARAAWNEAGNAFWYELDADGNMKPEGLPFELADIHLLTGNLAIGLGHDWRGNIEEKVAYNKIRNYRRDAAGRPIPNNESMKP